jgi:hypothetical protein
VPLGLGTIYVTFSKNNPAGFTSVRSISGNRVFCTPAFICDQKRAGLPSLDLDKVVYAGIDECHSDRATGVLEDQILV